MGRKTTVQAIERASGSKEYYIILPVAVVESMELEKGDKLDLNVTGKDSLSLKRGKE